MKNLLTILKTAVLTALFCAVMVYPSAQAVSSPLKASVTELAKYDPTGVWDYEVETPDGTLQDEMTIKKNEEGEYEVSIASDVYGTLVLQEVTFEKNVMEGHVEIEGDRIEFEMKFEGDSMEGSIYAGEDELTVTAERQKK